MPNPKKDRTIQVKPAEAAQKEQARIETIVEAIVEYNETPRLRYIAAKYGISKSSLERYIKNPLKFKELATRVADYGSVFCTSQVFTAPEEILLKDYITQSSKLCYGLSKVEIRELAFLFASANKKKTPEKWIEEERAGDDWLTAFMKRHKLSVRKPEATSLSRCTSFNKKNVGEYFDNLQSLMERFNFPPHNIYNCDETGLTTVQRPKNVVTEKGVKQVNKVTSAERGTLVTLLGTANAIGNSIPPFYVFPRKKMSERFLDRSVPGAKACAWESGWMTGSSFASYLEHFKEHAKPSQESPVLLIFDSHESHITAESLTFCKNNSIHLLTFPPHCTNKMQPLDVSVYSSLKGNYDDNVDRWLKAHPGRTLTIYEIAELSAQPILKAFTPSNIQSGFKKTGIYPFNRDAFKDEDFMCSEVTNRPNPEAQPLPQTAASAQQKEDHPNKTKDATLAGADKQPSQPSTSKEKGSVALTLEPVPSTSSSNGPDQIQQKIPPSAGNATVQVASTVTSKSSKSPSPLKFSPSDVRPFPKAGERKRKAGRQPLKTRILTDTPVKDQIMAELEERTLKRRKKEDAKGKKIRKQLEFSKDKENEKENESSCDEPDEAIPLKDCSDMESSSDDEDDLIDKEDRNFSVDDFILVEFRVKSKKIFYIGQILTIEENLFGVKFLRRKRQTIYFNFPVVDDVSNVMKNEVFCKLNTNSKESGTARTGKIYTFNYPNLFLELDVR